MSYKDLLAGLIYEGEIFQALNHFTFMNYKHLQFCDEHAKTVNQRSGGICLLTNKRILFLSSQLAVGEWELFVVSDACEWNFNKWSILDLNTIMA